ncbi:MAG: hypothetical protein PWP31_252 [Clostridia bacterium]|nr:hypothetical protein [Clostridia bacterium]
MSIFLIITAYMIIAFYEAPDLIKKGQFRELIVFSGLLILGLVPSILLVAGVDVPKPLDAIKSYSNLFLRLVPLF